MPGRVRSTGSSAVVDDRLALGVRRPTQRRSRPRRSRLRRSRPPSPRPQRPRPRPTMPRWPRQPKTRLRLLQAASLHAASAHAALAWAAEAQAAELKTAVPSAAAPTNWSSAAFGFGIFHTLQPTSRRDVDVTDAELTELDLRLCRRGQHERALDLIRRPTRMLAQEHRRRTRNHRGRERRAAQLHVSGRRDARRAARCRARRSSAPVRSCSDRVRRSPAS